MEWSKQHEEGALVPSGELAAKSGRRFSPRDKKARAYKRDHVLAVEFRQNFPRRWRRKKASAGRAFRRRLHEALSSQATELAADEDVRLDPQFLQREKVQKHWRTAVPLGEWVCWRQQRRLERLLFNFQAERPEVARERFARFLQSLTAGNSAASRVFAEYLCRLLEERFSQFPFDYYERKEAAWLTAFLRLEPAWERRLRSWVNALTD